MRRFGIVITATVLFSLLAASQAHAALMPKLEWSRSYDSPYTGDAYDWDRDCGKGIALDAAGNIYVTGHEDRRDLGQSDNIWVRKYNTNGDILWTDTYNGPAGDQPDYGASIAVDEAANVYVVGTERGVEWSRSDIWIRKYDTNGNILWTQTYDATDAYPGDFKSWDGGYGVALDAAGNVYACGRIEMDTQTINAWLGKYDTDGNLLWTRTYDSPSDVWPDVAEAHSVALDALGNIYVTGRDHRKDLGQYGNIWVRKYDASGNALWTDTYDGSAHHDDCGYGIAVDPAGNAYVVGTIVEGAQPLDLDCNIWVRKYDTDGNTLWTETYDSPGHHVDNAYGVALDDLGNVYVTGSENREDLGQGTNLFLRKYDPDGNTLWTLSYNGEAVSTAGFVGRGVAVDALGNICVTGYEHYLESGQYDDIMVLKFSQVPEPATLLLLAPALLGFAGVLRRRLKK